MRFESVKAYAFGPFRNETLELAPGMNVVYGPNETGKSSWHAALYAGLCGIRRARGRASKNDAEFAELHKPWHNDTSWDVGAIIRLDDGRRVELRHDLARAAWTAAPTMLTSPGGTTHTRSCLMALPTALGGSDSTGARSS